MILLLLSTSFCLAATTVRGTSNKDGAVGKQEVGKHSDPKKLKFKQDQKNKCEWDCKTKDAELALCEIKCDVDSPHDVDHQRLCQETCALKYVHCLQDCAT